VGAAIAAYGSTTSVVKANLVLATVAVTLQHPAFGKLSPLA
jgi:hypothetical protein